MHADEWPSRAHGRASGACLSLKQVTRTTTGVIEQLDNGVTPALMTGLRPEGSVSMVWHVS
jgi:hypothetical protein